MFNWKSDGWKVLLFGSVIAIIVFICINRRTSGTYSENITFHGNLKPNVDQFVIVNSGASSVGEQKCRQVAERLFNKPFLNVRPPFLKNKITNQLLELDCYNADLNLAIEYNGRQHYEYVPHFHKSHDDFVKQQYRDEFKRMMCKEHNVVLITIPYTVKNVDIEKYLKKELLSYGFFI